MSEAPHSSSTPRQPESRRKAWMGGIAGALFLAFAVFTGIFDAWEFEGPSMEPTLLNGDRVLSRPVDVAELERGDLIVARSPADDVHIIKRVVGLPGETVTLHDDVLAIDGVPFDAREEGPCEVGVGAQQRGCVRVRWAFGGRSWTTSWARRSMDPMPTTVPPGSVYVLGDHIDHSNDSRNPGLGPIGAEHIVGRVVYRYFSSGPDGLRPERMFMTMDEIDG